MQKIPGHQKGSSNCPLAQNTVFGWIISGEISNQGSPILPTSIAPIHSLHLRENTDHLLQRFWEIEELLPTTHLTEIEQRCESHFINTIQRDTNGRFVVSMPFQ